MDVTVDNFDEAMGLFEDVLSRAHFAAIDLEFTGLRSNNMLQKASLEPVRRQRAKSRCACCSLGLVPQLLPKGWHEQATAVCGAAVGVGWWASGVPRVGVQGRHTVAPALARFPPDVHGVV